MVSVILFVSANTIVRIGQPGIIRDATVSARSRTYVRLPALAIDDAAGMIDHKRDKSRTVPHPKALIPYAIVGDDVLRERPRRVARAVIEPGAGERSTFRAAADLRTRHPPRAGQTSGDTLALEGETALDAACRLAGLLDRSIHRIQVPRGAAKSAQALALQPVLAHPASPLDRNSPCANLLI